MNPIEKALATAEKIIAWDEDLTRAQAIAHAREVDTEVARLYGVYYSLRDGIARTEKDISDTQAYLAKAGGDPYGHATRRIQQLEADLPARKEKLRAALDAAWGYDADNYRGWSRFFLVQHIHSSLHCSSFRPTTRVGWLPDVSGLTEAEAVAAHGETLCTKCFPDAPVALTTKVDADVCTGTRDREAPSRTGYYSGNWATCTCGARVTLTKTGALRKHNPGGAK